MTNSARATAPRIAPSAVKAAPPTKASRVRKAAPAKKAAPPKRQTPTKTELTAKKVVAAKASAKKATATKVPAKKATPPKATAKKATATKAPAKKVVVAKAPTKKATVNKVAAAKSTPATVAQQEAPPVIAVPLTGDQWNDKNRELFHERIRIADEIEKFESTLPEERTPRMRQQLKRLRQQHDDITYKIFDSNYGLLRRYVRKFTQNASREDINDFEGAATVGLMRAITTYDPTKGRFAQWAFKPMQREVLRAVHSADHQNMNAGDFERRPDILRALHHLQDGDESARPAMEAIAKEAGVTVEQAKRVLQAPHLDSIYTPVGDGTTTLGEMLADETDNLEDNVITRMGVKDLENYGLSELDPRELFVIIRRQGLDCEPKQRLNSIGTTLGLSREAVRQIESRARGKLAHPVVLRKLARQGRD